MDSNLMISPPATDASCLSGLIEQATEAQILGILRSGARLHQVVATRSPDEKFTLTFLFANNRPAVILSRTRGGIRHFYTPSALLSWVLRQLPQCQSLQIRLAPQNAN